MKILITGGAGLIGSNLAKLLISKNYEVFIADNLWRGKLDNLRINNEYIINLDTHFYNVDLTNYESCLIVTKKIDLIIHLADIVAGINYVFNNELSLFRSNILINSNTLNAAIINKVPKILYVGTACSYPLERQSELNMPALKEDDVYPANPESSYGWSKLMGEYEIELANKMGKIQTGILRLHNVYGPPCEISPEKSQVIPSLIRKLVCNEDFIIWGKKKKKRAFVYVDDIIRGIAKYIEIGFGSGCIQLSSNTSTSISDIAKKLISIANKKVDIIYDVSKPEGDKDRTGNTSKARKILGWEPLTNLDDGLKLTYKWVEDLVNN